MAFISYDPLIKYNRRYQESLMTDSCVVVRSGVPVSWPRTSSTVIPCRIGEERTIVASPDPQDANTRSQNEWLATMPWDMPITAGDALTATFQETGQTFSAIVGETNLPQSWTIAARSVMSKPKTAVAPSVLLFRRDTDGDGLFETTLGPYNVAVVIDRVNPLEVPLRYAQAGRSSYAPVRLLFVETPVSPVDVDDIFVWDGKYGVVVAVTPNTPQQAEARAIVDFGGVN